MPKRSRNKIIPGGLKYAQEISDKSLRELAAVLRREWRNRPEDATPFGYEPDDFDDEAGEYDTDVAA